MILRIAHQLGRIRRLRKNRWRWWRWTWSYKGEISRSRRRRRSDSRRKRRSAANVSVALSTEQNSRKELKECSECSANENNTMSDALPANDLLFVIEYRMHFRVPGNNSAVRVPKHSSPDAVILLKIFLSCLHRNFSLRWRLKRWKATFFRPAVPVYSARAVKWKSPKVPDAHVTHIPCTTRHWNLYHGPYKTFGYNILYLYCTFITSMHDAQNK